MQSFQHCNSWNGPSALSDVKSDSLVLLYNVTHTFRWSSHFWCDFQAQQTNLVQVARSLGRAVPLSPQFIFTPTASVTAVQPETSALSIYTPPTSGQVTLIYTSLTYIYTNMCCFFECPTKVTSVFLCSGAELGSSWPAGGADFLPLSVSVTEPECETVPRGISTALCD